MSNFIISYDELPVSVNEYLKPSAKIVNGRPIVHLYETKKAKDFKKRFQAYLKREVKKQGWDKSITDPLEGHWILECIFVQSRTNQDNNNYFKILCDSLSGIVTIDDKNILVRTKKVMYDAKNPRFVAVLKPAEYIGVFNSKEALDEFDRHNCSLCKKDKSKCAILRKAKEGRIQEDIEGMTCKKKRV
ncbi:RusA family crossover junction endodeoxyribonuclease [Priestia megaterium]|uniref:RusA family crossover junction endodeoxyribonuclease n=1 Tax=Priestia megaterium TaxID=1404 RepID=UPI002E215E79|nr:RusA family crossover junction endodeoxyribonuclease [Priestia megaterium]MED3976174.1 RusA family crossover junction endodeoxyribonuclease [Priestia megaterium]